MHYSTNSIGTIEWPSGKNLRTLQFYTKVYFLMIAGLDPKYETMKVPKKTLVNYFYNCGMAKT